MLVLSLSTEIPLSEPTVDYGFISTVDVVIREFDAASREPVGRATIRIINVADAINRGVGMHDVLDADSEEMFELFETFFDEHEYLKESFANGVGSNVMYFAEIDLAPAWRGRRIEEAIVLRLADTWGEGCAIAVIPVETQEEAARWAAAGFKPAGDDRKPSYVYLDLSLKHPDVFASDDRGHAFDVRDVGD